MSTQLERLDQQLEAITARIPVDLDERIRAGNDIVDSRSGLGLSVGAFAPGFVLPNATGRLVDLASLLAQGPVVVSFYRGEWCPYCNLELRALQGHLDEITGLGATIVAISPQATDYSLALTDKHGLGFDVLSDVDQTVIAAYHLQFDVDGDNRDILEHVFHLDLAEQNADKSWRLTVPATFVLDRDGIVRAAHVSADYRTRMEPTAIVAAIAALT